MNTQASTTAAPPLRVWGGAAVTTSLATLVAALLFGGGGTSLAVPGLGDPGDLTRWGLPVAKAVMNSAGAVTVGLIGMAVLFPVQRGQLGGDALRALRAASWTALVWAVGAATVHLLTLSDLIGQPVWQAVGGEGFRSYTASVAQGQAYAAVVVLALALIPAARLTLGHGGGVALLCLAVATLIPPNLVGHSSSGDYHHSATTSIIIHVLAMAFWVGGLVALTWYAGKRGRYLPKVARTYSSVALACFFLIATSGVLNSWVRLASLSDLATTAYGVLLLGKVAALIGLGYVGYTHRRRTLAGLDAGRPGQFRRLAAGEIVIMAAALGLAVALSRTEPPVPDDLGTISRTRELLGFPIPPEFSPSQIFTEFYPDALFGIGCLAAVLLYGAGVLRLRRRGDRWPVGRSLAWLAGIATVAFVELSGIMTYSMTMLSVHMVQHMTLMMVAPILLVLGGPITLALRAIKPARRGEKGPREWLMAAVQSRVAKILTHPVVALTLFVSGSFLMYFTGLFEAAMREHTGHMLMSLHFLAVGYIFYEMLIGIDPLPKRPPFPARVVLQLLAMAFHAFFGLAVMESSRLIAGAYYRELEIPWLPDPLDDQILAGQITWGFGELPALVIVGVLFVQWYRSDEREARRFDRREGKAEAERTAYNSYLASLDARAKRDVE
ncbi:bifunctional copper resistance protein CopD/cytochrome c oxidase assembly protein [Phytoactinopolyspora alkaliphila]|uniref:Bifunctional copper resistance protein CopD/cytochrome c oxidase assembly protein n=1 Tax=Phytoactinopolyspora alkaliphila TaxID=1783498 RepID=A0A6N9YM08_9ACTN|nr:cytochrome c oxidase assembly protein [Phytoactinopolyspora alkaliphila]NED96033.1 bifunctional copper resistance protein CopD/cytochrome c oxidase assembly protein [Phytoactinopolyspora alkaliphila]